MIRLFSSSEERLLLRHDLRLSVLFRVLVLTALDDRAVSNSGTSSFVVCRWYKLVSCLSLWSWSRCGSDYLSSSKGGGRRGTWDLETEIAGGGNHGRGIAKHYRSPSSWPSDNHTQPKDARGGKVIKQSAMAVCILPPVMSLLSTLLGAPLGRFACLGWCNRRLCPRKTQLVFDR